jgi:aldehyde:ferredoxin oxidoreductase
MESFEAGDLTTDDTGGLALNFGNAESMVKLVEMIGKREGFGNILAEGSAKAAEQIGCGADFLITSKGQEAAAHMPQIKCGLGLIYAVNPFGSDHQSSEHDGTYEVEFEEFKDRLAVMDLTQPQEPQSLGTEKINFVRKTQHLYSLMDSLNLCQFVFGPSWQLYGPAEIVKIVQAVTGWDVDIDELLEVGERRLNMMRAFNAREGITRKQDKLPSKFFTKPLKGGPTDGWKLNQAEFDTALDEYYRQLGWDAESGTPTRQGLERLGLSWVADNLKL